MTLIQRLRGIKWMVNDEMRGLVPDTTAHEAADTIEALTVALHDAINAPKGVVPASAKPFYQQWRGYHD